MENLKLGINWNEVKDLDDVKWILQNILVVPAIQVPLNIYNGLEGKYKAYFNILPADVEKAPVEETPLKEEEAV